MCFYPVCIILRPAAALSAAARARLGPGSGSRSSALAAGPCRSSGRFGSRAWAEAEFINNPRPPLWGGGSLLAEDAPPSLRDAPRLLPLGDRRGEGDRGEGGALGNLVALLGLTSARCASPGAPRRSCSGWDARPTARTGPSGGAGCRTGRGPLGTPPADRTQDFLPLGSQICLPRNLFFFLKGRRGLVVNIKN